MVQKIFVGYPENLVLIKAIDSVGKCRSTGKTQLRHEHWVPDVLIDW